MKKYFQRMVLVAVAVAAAQVAVAESWRINNDASKGANFASINDAMDSEDVEDGDTLYLDPGCVLSEAQTITKAVTVIGTGWDFSDKPYVPARITEPLYINSAAKVMSLKIDNCVYINNENIVLERCAIGNHVVAEANKSYSNQNLQVINCYLTNGKLSGENSMNATGWRIYSTYIYRTRNSSCECLINIDQATIANCFIYSSYSTNSYALKNVKNSTIKNNIIIKTGETGKNKIISGENNVFSYNCLSASEGDSVNNTCTGKTDLASFIVNTGVGGEFMKLSESSLAKEAGEGGIDCGPYAEGSLYPFVTYGLPKNIPYFEEAVIPTQPTNGKISVTLKIKPQNQ